ncbi:bifunctional hydroxymethylpyrimidine kinase/phosphomethylpyrimidine kinase [Coxiella-like endosymbiont of Rhipicephalus sanguineus]|uniref:bifunctional hydroxymethylpyrimidine kinase/phosphomethylpyrimidine kinase n=1 Tax=Coxiella-like endosymbiont of Rhipicephalus sanguineus TaxID=1955402 RepID=UPI00255B3111|nr:bifunctional hydroxymethylpyrimidine kinase/phosphomethylpyrimidine kinase [Coxiella-like endosymbiont of Rhipicephalus sanguineus]
MGSAGCQVDLLKCHDFDVHAATIITALIAQNAHQVLEILYLSHLIKIQITSLEKAFVPSVIKFGLLGKKNNFGYDQFLFVKILICKIIKVLSFVIRS